MELSSAYMDKQRMTYPAEVCYKERKQGQEEAPQAGKLEGDG